MSATERTQADGYGTQTGWLTDATLLKLWGVVVGAGWLVTQVAALAGGPPDQQFLLGLTAFWLVGSLVPITASLAWMRRHAFTGLFPTWTLLGVTGLAASTAVVLELLPVPAVYVLGGLWFVGPAVGFVVTARYMDDWSAGLYAGAAAANLAGAAAILLVPGFEMVYFTAAAVVQGLPMLYHGVRLDG